MVVIGDRYEVIRELGSGGFGTTYAATDRQTGGEVAVKVLDLSRVDDWKAVELFEREARALRSLDHPGIPAYVAFQPLEDERQAYLVQGLAPGRDLASLLETRRFTEADLIALTTRVLEIFDYLTSLHPVVIHRDIKPSNILLADDGMVSVVDFGCVRDIANPKVGGGSTVAGTFGYMAPEQLQGEATPSSDLYGLGMTLVHLATGRLPSDFDKKRLKPDFRPHAHFSRAFEQFIDKLIEPVPDDRFQTAAEALAALRDVSENDDALSSEQIARRLQAANREASTALARRPTPAPVVKVADPKQRITFTEDEDGATIAIRPSAYWRDLEVYFGLLIVGGPILVGIAAATAGLVGFVVGAIGTIGFGALLWLTAPTWRLRLTDRGDFMFYKRSPKRPRLLGSARQLAVETVRTERGDYIGHLRFERDGQVHLHKHFYPLTSRDRAALEKIKRWTARHGGKN